MNYHSIEPENIICTVMMYMETLKFVTLCSREPPQELTPEERDARTVFCMQLSARIRPRDLEEFFSSVGIVSSDCYNCKYWAI